MTRRLANEDVGKNIPLSANYVLKDALILPFFILLNF